MATLPPSNSPLAQHLADRALTPIISTATATSTSNPSPESQAQLQALSTLTTTAITAFESASRLGLGVPQRIMIETQSGPVILHSYLTPQRPQPPVLPHGQRGIIEQAREELRPLSGTTESESLAGSKDHRGEHENGIDDLAQDFEVEADAEEEEEEEEAASQQPPTLIATVITPSQAGLGDARRAAAKLESIGKEIQREWVRIQEEPQDGDSIESG